MGLLEQSILDRTEDCMISYPRSPNIFTVTLFYKSSLVYYSVVYMLVISASASSLISVTSCLPF